MDKIVRIKTASLEVVFFSWGSCKNELFRSMGGW